MTKNEIIEKIDRILERKNFKFHSFNKEEFSFGKSAEESPQTAYYHQREILDIINELFEEELEYSLNEQKDKIYIKYS